MNPHALHHSWIALYNPSNLHDVGCAFFEKIVQLTRDCGKRGEVKLFTVNLSGQSVEELSIRLCQGDGIDPLELLSKPIPNLLNFQTRNHSAVVPWRLADR